MIALSTTLTLSACADVLFNADFESDVAGRLPSSSPAGPPTGDMIRVWIPDAGNLAVTASGINGKSLSYRHNPTITQVDFIGIETGRNVPEYWAAWNGRAAGFSGTTAKLSFSVGNFNTGRANFEIVDGDFVASGDVLGDVVFDEDHTVVIRVGNRAGTYSVSVFQRRSRMLNLGTKPLSSRGVIPGDRVFDIVMSFGADLTPGINATYLIDDIRISETPPDTP